MESCSVCLPLTGLFSLSIMSLRFIHIVTYGCEVRVAQLCPTLCDPMDYKVHGILQARILERIGFPFSSGSSQSRDRTQISYIAGRFFTSWATRLNIIPLSISIYHMSYVYPEKTMAPHSSILTWKIPWMEEPSRLQSMGSLRVGHDWATSLSLFTFLHWRRKWQPTPVFLPGESQGWGSLVGCCLWGRTESDMTEAT